MPDVSVIVLTRNAERTIGRVLDAVYRQVCDLTFEVIVVDSSSTDRTAEVVARYPCRLVTIPVQEFHHGATRNLGARLAQGRYLVFLTDHAVPAREDWLATLLAPLADPAVAGVYGGQLPWPDASPMEQYFLSYMYGSEPRVQERGAGPVNINVTWFSNVNGAVRRDVWQRFPFSETVVMSEDQAWTKDVLLAGYRVVYVPAAAVFHSHNYSLVGAFRRFFDSGMSSHDSFLPEGGGGLAYLFRYGLRYLAGEARFLIRHGYARWLPYALVYEATKFLGLAAGRLHRLFPPRVKTRLSHHLYLRARNLGETE